MNRYSSEDCDFDLSLSLIEAAESSSDKSAPFNFLDRRALHEPKRATVLKEHCGDESHVGDQSHVSSVTDIILNHSRISRMRSVGRDAATKTSASGSRAAGMSYRYRMTNQKENGSTEEPAVDYLKLSRAGKLSGRRDVGTSIDSHLVSSMRRLKIAPESGTSSSSSSSSSSVNTSSSGTVSSSEVSELQYLDSMVGTRTAYNDTPQTILVDKSEQTDFKPRRKRKSSKRTKEKNRGKILKKESKTISKERLLTPEEQHILRQFEEKVRAAKLMINLADREMESHNKENQQKQEEHHHYLDSNLVLGDHRNKLLHQESRKEGLDKTPEDALDFHELCMRNWSGEYSPLLHPHPQQDRVRHVVESTTGKTIGRGTPAVEKHSPIERHRFDATVPLVENYTRNLGRAERYLAQRQQYNNAPAGADLNETYVYDPPVVVLKKRRSSSRSKRRLTKKESPEDPSSTGYYGSASEYGQRARTRTDSLSLVEDKIKRYNHRELKVKDTQNRPPSRPSTSATLKPGTERRRSKRPLSASSNSSRRRAAPRSTIFSVR